MAKASMSQIQRFFIILLTPQEKHGVAMRTNGFLPAAKIKGTRCGLLVADSVASGFFSLLSIDCSGATIYSICEEAIMTPEGRENFSGRQCSRLWYKPVSSCLGSNELKAVSSWNSSIFRDVFLNTYSIGNRHSARPRLPSI